APLVAAGLFVVAELGDRASSRAGGTAEPALALRSAAWLVAGLIGTVALGAVLLGAAGAAKAGVGLEALGVAAAVGALGLLVALLTRAGR
ncbi:MAG: hypothetical protein LC713_07420, partial [Actinobacteria bacterium]|nr:hypothetical protein [Actinomycetota bacterium]